MRGTILHARSSYLSGALKTSVFVVTMCFLVGCPATPYSNVPYKASLERGSPVTEATPLAESLVPYEVTLDGMTINDVAGNDLERRILEAARVIKRQDADQANGKSGRPLSTAGQADRDLFSNELVAEVRVAAEEAKNKGKGISPNATGKDIGIDDLVASALKQIKTSLLAEYEVTGSVTVRKFDFAAADKTFKTTWKKRQTELGNPNTSDLRWSGLLYRGSGVDIADLELKLHRTSAISRAFDAQLKKLENSKFFENLLSDALTPILSNIGGSLGRSIGSRIDRALYEEAKARYGPTFDIGTGNSIFITALRTGAGELLAPQESFRLYEGETEVRLIARFEKNSHAEAKLVETKLNVKKLRKD